MANKVDIKAITSSAIVPTPDGYYLDLWTDLQEEGDGQRLDRYRFQSVSQMTDHSREARRIALLATGYEELSLNAEDVQEDDMLPFLNGGSIYSIDSEKRFSASTVLEAVVADGDNLADLRDGAKTRYMIFTFSGSAAEVSMPADNKLTVLRKIQQGEPASWR